MPLPFALSRREGVRNGIMKKCRLWFRSDSISGITSFNFLLYSLFFTPFYSFIPYPRVSMIVRFLAVFHSESMTFVRPRL